jgi:Flp pilus assembly protein TadG
MRTPAHPEEHETGAVSLFLGVFIVVAVACAALALDLGNAWQSQRRLHTASDAGALAAASVYAGGGQGCATEADAYVQSNNSGAQTTCTATTFDSAGSAGYVSVRAAESVSFTFAAAFGVPTGHVSSRTTVQWGPPKGATAVRPLGLCLYYPGLSSWLNLPTGPTGPSGVINVPFSNSVTGCNASSNWGWLDLSGSAGGNDVNDWLDNGYSGTVPVPSSV